MQGHIGGFFIADFAYQNNVGVLAQNRAQALGKGVALFGLNL